MTRLDRCILELKQYELVAATLFADHRYGAALMFYRVAASIVEVEKMLSPELPTAYYNLARAYQFAGWYEYALIYYTFDDSSVKGLGYIFDQILAFAHCWCRLGELRAISAALKEAVGHDRFFEFEFVSKDSPGYCCLMEAVVVLDKVLSDQTLTSKQKANSYALMRHVRRLEGKSDEAMHMHDLCVKHGGSEYDTIGHGLLMAQQDKEGAIAYLEDVIEQPIVDQFRKRDAHSAMGVILALNGQLQEARDHHLNALRMSLKQRCSIVAMITYFHLGQLDHRASNDLLKSPLVQMHYRKGLLLAEKLNGKTVGYSDWNKHGLLARDELKRMKELYQHRLELAEQDSFAIADALVNLNNGYTRIGYDEKSTLESVHEALRLVSRLPEDAAVMELRATCYSHLGRVHFRLSNREVTVHGTAHKEARKNALDSIDTAINLHHKLGNDAEAIEMLLLRAHSEPARKEDLQNALRVLAGVEDQNPNEYHQNLTAEARVGLLSILSHELRHEEGKATIEEFMSEFALCKQATEESSVSALVYIEAYTIMARIHTVMSDDFRQYSAMEKKFRLQDEFYEDLGLSKASSLVDVRTVFREVKLKFSKLSGAGPPPEVEGDEPYTECLDWMSFYLEEVTAAEDIHLAHLDLARRRRRRDFLARSLAIVGAFYERIEKHKEAQKFLEEATLIQSDFLLGLQAINGASLEHMNGMQRAYQALLSCIAAQKDSSVHEEGLLWAERLRARTLSHAMQLKSESDPLVEITRFLTDKELALKSLKDFSISCPDVVFVEYALLPTKLLIWVVKNGSIVLREMRYHSSVDLIAAHLNQIMETVDLESELTREIDDRNRSLRKLIGITRDGVIAFIQIAVGKIRNSVSAENYLNLLGGFLLGPIVEDLSNVAKDQCIVFIPHEELAYVPFAALRFNGDYLIKLHQVAVSMSLRVYAFSLRSYHEKMKRRRHRVGSSALLVSNPFPLDTAETMGLQSGSNVLKPLASAEKEAEIIVKCMKQKAKDLQVVHLNRHRAQKVAVMKVLPDADWVHFACHGFVSQLYPLGALPLGQTVHPIPLRWLLFLIAHIYMLLGLWLPSFVYQRPARTAESVGILAAEDILPSEMGARCVILNVCNSVKGQITADGVLNWSHTLQQAGVPSIVLSLWEVQDLAAYKFMSELYTHLANNEHLAAALQKAMITMIDDGDNWQPRHWASYNIIGVPEVQLPGCES